MTDPIDPKVKREEGLALARLWRERRNDPDAVTQSEFGAGLGVTQGLVWQWMNGRTALTLEAAEAFSRYLGVSISVFSPRLAAEKIARERSPWPFKTLDYSRWASLTDGQKIALEGILHGHIVDMEASGSQPAPAASKKPPKRH